MSDVAIERSSPDHVEAGTEPTADGRAASRERTRTVEEFLDTRAGAVHPIFDANTGELPPPRDRTSLRETFDNLAGVHRTQFLEAMETHQVSMKNPKFSKIDLRGKQSWAEVMQVAKEAEQSYQKSGEKLWRKFGRVATSYSPAALPFTRLIPDEGYLSVLAGGLKLVFGALSSVGERRAGVLEALLRVPEAIFLAESCVDNFSVDATLCERAVGVYVTALAAIEGTTRWLLSNAALKPIKAMRLGPIYNRSFESKIKALEKSLIALQECVNVLRDGAVIRTEKVVGRIATVVDQVERKGDAVNSTTKATLRQVNSLQSDIKGLDKSQGATKAKIDQMQDWEQTRKAARDAMKIVLKETTKTAKFEFSYLFWMKQKDRVILRLKNRVEYLEKAAAALTQPDLLDIVGIKAEISRQDLDRVVRRSFSADPWSSNLTKGVIQTPKYQEWHSEDASAALFVESGLALTGQGRNSPISILCSSVIEDLDDEGPSVTIHHFCALHSSAGDTLNGPRGLIRSLISQVLRIFPVDLSFIAVTRHVKLSEALNLQALCDCFVKLVKQLPVDTVLFCIIDSINFFERREWIDDCKQVVAVLNDLAEDENINPVFKLLLTSSTRSKLIKKILAPECCIWVGPGNGGRDGPTQREMNMAARRPRREQYKMWAEEDYTSLNEEEFMEFLTSSDESDRSKMPAK